MKNKSWVSGFLEGAFWVLLLTWIAEEPSQLADGLRRIAQAIDGRRFAPATPEDAERLRRL